MHSIPGVNELTELNVGSVSHRWLINKAQDLMLYYLDWLKGFFKIFDARTVSYILPHDKAEFRLMVALRDKV